MFIVSYFGVFSQYHMCKHRHSSTHESELNLFLPASASIHLGRACFKTLSINTILCLHCSHFASKTSDAFCSDQLIFPNTITRCPYHATPTNMRDHSSDFLVSGLGWQLLSDGWWWVICHCRLFCAEGWVGELSSH